MKWPDGERLLLTIDRVVEDVECGHCDETFTNDDPCPACHGTGKRRVRVRGWVECSLDQEFVYVGSISEWECETKLIEKVFAAYLAGTLPDGVAHIEEVDE